MGDRWWNKHEGEIQVLLTGLVIATLGFVAGCWFSIETTLILSSVVIGFIIVWFGEQRKQGSNEGEVLGMVFLVIPALSLFIIPLLLTGLIVHWDNFMYMLRGLFS